MTVWNSHRIRKGVHGVCGRPYILYSVPELYDAYDYICQVEEERVEICLEECTFLHLPCDNDIHELAKLNMEENGWQTPRDAFEAAELYVSLRNLFRHQLDNDE